MDWNVVEVVILTVITVVILYIFWMSGGFLIIAYPILFLWSKLDKKQKKKKKQITVVDE